MDEREGDSDIYVRKFENGAWQNEIPITPEQSYQSDSRNPSLMTRPAFGLDPEMLWIAWVDNPGTQSPAPPYEAYYKIYNTVTGQLGDLANLSSTGGDPVVFRATGYGSSRNGISMTSNSDGSRIYIFYANDLGNDPDGGPLGRVMTRTFENGSLGSEVGVSELGSWGRLFPFALADNVGNTFLAHNKVNPPRAAFRIRNTFGVWGSEIELGTLDQKTFAYNHGVPWFDRDAAGNIHVSWHGGVQDHRKIYYRKYFLSTATWDPPLNDPPTILADNLEEAETFSSVSADHSGDVWAFWHNEITSGF
jgi:hypothetical protein